MKKIIITLVLTCSAMVLLAQQDPQYTQFMFNKLALNPAYAGSKHALCASVLYRKQWVGINGAPTTQVLNVHGVIRKKNIGLGLSVVHDEIGIFNNWTMNFIYDYHLRLGKGKLNIGGQVGIDYLRAQWDLSEPDQVGDYAIPGGSPSKVFPNFGVGAYYHTKNYYIGLSVPTLMKSSLEFDGAQQNSGQDVISNQDRHFFLMGGFVVPVSEKIKFKPAILLKYVQNAPFDMDINASFLFFNKLWLGATYRYQDSIDGVLQFQFNHCFKVGLGYDYTLTELQKYNSGSFEIMLEYCIIPKDEINVNPRFF